MCRSTIISSTAFWQTSSQRPPVSRVLAYSRAKARALIPILTAEQKHLGDSIRAVVLCDFEKSSAVTAELDHLLDEESGGAIAAFRELLTDEATDKLDPILLTGSSVLVDDDLKDTFESAARHWLASARCHSFALKVLVSPPLMGWLFVESQCGYSHSQSQL